MDDIWCEECGAQFAENCFCPENQEYVAYMREQRESEPMSTWRGMDGHKYTGNPSRSSQASHDDDCGCPGSVNFDPDSWY